MSAHEISKGDDPLEPPRARTRTQGSAPMREARGTTPLNPRGRAQEHRGARP
jgi:hypothetical protein